MSTRSISFGISKFRAINSAELSIDGITVLCGENGCGKSTLSKLLYYSISGLTHFEELVVKKLEADLQEILTFFTIFQHEILFYQRDRDLRNDFRREVDDLRKTLGNSDFLSEMARWKAVVDQIEYIVRREFPLSQQDIFGNTMPTNLRLQRLTRILKNSIGVDMQSSELNLEFDKIRLLIESKFKEANGKLSSRPFSLFRDNLVNRLESEKLPKKIEIKEFDGVILSAESQNLSIPYSVRKSIYVDTPMMISVESLHHDHWKDLNKLLLNKENSQRNLIAKIISDEIINGDVEMEDGIFFSDEFKFKRKDGEVFKLLDVATGVKAFSILLLLLKNGHLNDKTLLIIDEPESNLHPQWVIEYARVVVLLNKTLGVKFLLASHSPDFVSAIRYISEKEGVLDNLNFYLAEKSELGGNSYNYRHLGYSIDSIYGSFNIALDRINQYGIQE